MLFNGQICYIKILTWWRHPKPKQLIFMTGEDFLKHLKVLSFRSQVRQS